MLSDSSFSTRMLPSDERATTSVNVPPRSIAKVQLRSTGLPQAETEGPRKLFQQGTAALVDRQRALYATSRIGRGSTGALDLTQPPSSPRLPAQLRVAIVHYWLLVPGGGEQVLRTILQLFPDADVFTLLSDERFTRSFLPNVSVKTSFLQKIPFSYKFHTKLLPLMPAALETLDLRGYDLIISSEAGPAKGVLSPLGSTHVCYCHSPMRYLWDQFEDYQADSSALSKLVFSAALPRLRTWDVVTAARVDRFAANSRHVQARIKQYWRRESEVIFPPVDIAEFHPNKDRSDYYLMSGRHVPYKRFDIAIEACKRLGRRLIITGRGRDTQRLKRMAGPSIEFVDQCSRTDLARLYENARAFLMPAEEDFGIAPVEAMAAGCPVIAFGRGGALDTIVPGVSGVFFNEQSVDSLVDAICSFESREDEFDASAIAEQAQQFDASEFKKKFTNFVWSALERPSSNVAPFDIDQSAAGAADVE
jgi:glycosyltransferase involved in cell wall biosynthesis